MNIMRRLNARPRVLFLCSEAEANGATSQVGHVLKLLTPEVRRTHHALTITAADLLVSYRYRHKVEPRVLAETPAVNLHMGYLPYNRGAHPLFWALAQNEPLGVTLHWMDEGIDTGAIIGQAGFPSHTRDFTMRSLYEFAEVRLAGLLRDRWNDILALQPGAPQEKPPCTPAYHKAADLELFGDNALPQGWNTPAKHVLKWGQVMRGCMDVTRSEINHEGMDNDNP